MARRYNSNPVSNAMAWLGGARLDVLADTPGDRARFVAMGGVILSTALLSAVSAAFALSMAVGAPLAVAIVVGVFWGVIILNLDRLLIIGMAKQKGVARNIGLAIPRIALALIIGTVISTPLTLQIFAAEINSEIQVMQAEEKAAFEERMASDPRFAAIPGLEESIAANQAIVDKGLQTDLSADPNYAAAQAATASAQAAYDAAQAAYLAEIDGSGGTGVRGDGPVTASKLAALQTAEARLDAAKQAEAAALTAAQSNLEASAQSRLSAAQDQLAADKATLATAQEQRAAEQAAYENAVDNSAGLLSRLDALFRLGEKNALLNVAHIMIAALFVCIELLPVIVKVLSNLGSPTAYDRMLDVREDSEVSGGEIWARERARAIEAEASVQVSVASDRAEQQLEFGKRINAAVLEQQEAVISRALEVWGSYAGARAAARMEEWERELESGEAGQGAGALGAGGPAADPQEAAPAKRWPFSRNGAGNRTTPVAREIEWPARFAPSREDSSSRPRDLAETTRFDALLGGASADQGLAPARDDAPTERFDRPNPRDADRDATDELADLFRDTAELSTSAGRTPGDPPTRPLPRNSDRADYLRRAGLPDNL
ncbi:DUF4407 domain-containing protein [Herbiconiux sp. A18JL235]|uniref:DUF4407 domain-containing protein n=1 Tax=Herbiconiux sp. A18JL235 TaxID=3152363 RepID=A0AB39BDR1_9MICO